MKKTITLIFFLTIGHSYGQDSCALLKQASVQYCNQELNEAISTLSEFVERFPNHELCEEALVKIADLNLELKEYDKARILYEAVLVNQENNAPDKFHPLDCPTNYHSLFPDRKYGCMRIIFPWPYSNLTHRSAIGLAKTYNAIGQYPTALTNLGDAENKYRYRTDCGNDAIGKSNQIALLYSDIYANMGNQKKAIDILINESLEIENRFVLIKLDSLLKMHYTTNELKMEFDKAKINLTKIPADSSERKIELYRTYFLGNEIEFPSYYIAEGQNLADYLYKTWFYKEIIKE